LTAPERLTAPGVVIHLPSCRALARKASVRSECDHNLREPRLLAPPQPLPQMEPKSVQLDSSRLAYPILTKATWRQLKSHR
jgi:hypothetical protein